jgi:hypothetical protein
MGYPFVLVLVLVLEIEIEIGIEPAYRFCSILPKETENAKAFKELCFAMTPAARCGMRDALGCLRG